MTSITDATKMTASRGSASIVSQISISTVQSESAINDILTMRFLFKRILQPPTLPSASRRQFCSRAVVGAVDTAVDTLRALFEEGGDTQYDPVTAIR